MPSHFSLAVRVSDGRERSERERSEQGQDLEGKRQHRSRGEGAEQGWGIRGKGQCGGRGHSLGARAPHTFREHLLLLVGPKSLIASSLFI